MSEEELTLFGNEGEKKPRRWVTVSNEMIMARLDWNIMMHRILMVLISQIDSKNDEQFRTQRVPVRRIRDMAQVTQKSIHEEAAEAASKLVREPIEFWSADKRDYEGYPIFAKCKYESRQGMIEAKFNEDARPFLLQLRKHFTQYRLEQAIPLSTPYAIRTYEVSKMIERPDERRSRQIPVERFRSMFKLEHKYKRHCDMRRRVIDPSVKEVNEKTDVEISCDDVRDGQTPIALNWVVLSKEAEVEDKESDELPPRHNPEPQKKREHEIWFERLSSDEQEEIMKRARERALNNGYTEDQPRSFSAGVMHMVNQIYQEETSANADV
jgi:plasmid replication initiation protein